MFTSVIIPFRNATPIPLCLTSLEICEGISQHTVVIMQQGGRRIDVDRQDVALQYFFQPYDGPFNAGLLCNLAVKAAQTEYVTILNPWLIVPPNFLTVIEDEIFKHDYRLTYFPVRHLDSDTTVRITQRFNYFYENVIPISNEWRVRCEMYKSQLIGTDCFTIKRSDYLDLGGYDQYYRNTELAYLDFACRWLKAFGLPRRAPCDVYHRWRPLNCGEEHTLWAAASHHYFRKREMAGFPPLERIAH